MTPSRLSTWPLRLILVLSLAGPAIVLSYVIWANLEAIDQRTTERIERALDSIHEHALKVLQTVERSIAETNEVLRGLSDDDIREDESRVSQRLKQTQEALPHLQSIWAFDRNGVPLVSSTVLPVPRALNNSDRDYFRAQTGRDAGLYIGDIVQARVGTLRFFVVSGRRPERPDGSFNGVIGVTVLPEHFRQFYGKLASSVADSFGLIRADGAFLARYPQVLDRPERLGPQSEFVKAIESDSRRGMFTVRSSLDGIERRIGYRQVTGFPVYVQVGIETAAMSRELRGIVVGHLAFGLPATLSLFALALYALRRAQRFQAEVGRREAAESALKQAQRLEAMGQLTGGVAHDFNNLLMVIGGNAERLKKYPPIDDRQQRALSAISTAVIRGASLTRQLLSFSRRQTHDPKVIDLRERLGELEQLVTSSMRSDILFSFKVVPDLWPVKVDESEFELALLNLAVNARDSMPRGGQLVIDAQNLHLADVSTIGLTGDFVALSVADTGGGIPAEVLPKVFEPFFTTKEPGKGTGLGLSQVYGFAQQSGGRAAISSQPGRGTVVTLYLPRCGEAVAAAVSTPVAKETAIEPQGRGQILLVEDNDSVAEITVTNLDTLGYQATRARDAAAALSLLSSSPTIFDLVITDIVMPGSMNGLSLARLLRAQFGDRLPILVVTGYSDEAHTASNEGWVILRKPYDTAQLRDAMARALRAARLQPVERMAQLR
jgi:two-component system, NtrC family, sensor kinase